MMLIMMMVLLSWNDRWEKTAKTSLLKWLWRCSGPSCDDIQRVTANKLNPLKTNIGWNCCWDTMGTLICAQNFFRTTGKPCVVYEVLISVSVTTSTFVLVLHWALPDKLGGANVRTQVVRWLNRKVAKSIHLALTWQPLKFSHSLDQLGEKSQQTKL